MSQDEKNNSLRRLGFIGLGHLGSPIAKRLAAARFPLLVYDPDRAKAAEFLALGAEVAPDSKTLASQVDVVLSCLPDGAVVESVYLGSGAVLKNIKRGTRIIEMSTVAPETSQKIYQAAKNVGISMLDVAVSGSSPSAKAGTLTLLGGGEREVFESVESIFAPIAHQWFYMGPSGSGVAMKLVVNTLLGVGMQAIAESLALGLKLGLPRESLFDTLAKTAVVAPAHAGKLRTTKRDDYAPQFPARLMHKDFGLILGAASRLGVPMPATTAASAVNSLEAASGREEDFSAVVRRMEQEAGEESVLPPAA